MANSRYAVSPMGYNCLVNTERFNQLLIVTVTERIIIVSVFLFQIWNSPSSVSFLVKIPIREILSIRGLWQAYNRLSNRLFAVAKKHSDRVILSPNQAEVFHA